MDSNTSFPTFQSFGTLLLLWQFLPQQFSLMKAECSCGQRKTTGGWKSNGVVISCLIWLTLIIGRSIHDKVYSPIIGFQYDPEVFGVYTIIFALIIPRLFYFYEVKGERALFFVKDLTTELWMSFPDRRHCSFLANLTQVHLSSLQSHWRHFYQQLPDILWCISHYTTCCMMR